MNIKRFIDQNRKSIWYIVIIIFFVLFAIKLLNSYYKEEEKRKKIEAAESVANSQEAEKQNITENDYTTESNSIELTMSSFVNYCNKRELEKAYNMLTEECKEAMFPTVEDFKKIYIDIVYKINREYDLVKWSTDRNKSTYLVTLYGNILATGGTDNSTQEYYTFVEDDNGNYKLNVNNYIYGEDRNIVNTVSNITIKIGHVDIYEEYEEAKITITNNTAKTICLTGNKYKKNIYLKNLLGIGYSPLNSEFETREITMRPNSFQTFKIRFNKAYSANNKATKLVLSDIILDYENYLKSEDKDTYSNRISIEINY